MAEPRRVLVVKLADLGDVLLSEPALRSLRQGYPDARIDVLTTPHAAELLPLLDPELVAIPFAKELFDKASAASEHVGDGAGTILAGYGYGLLAQVRGDWREARQRFTAAYSGFETLGTPVPQGLALAGLARCDEASGDLTSAHDRYEEVLATGRRVGEPGLTSTALEGLGRLALGEGDRNGATSLFSQAADIRTRFARPAPPHERRDLEAVAVGSVG